MRSGKEVLHIQPHRMVMDEMPFIIGLMYQDWYWLRKYSNNDLNYTNYSSLFSGSQIGMKEIVINMLLRDRVKTFNTPKVIVELSTLVSMTYAMSYLKKETVKSYVQGTFYLREFNVREIRLARASHCYRAFRLRKLYSQLARLRIKDFKFHIQRNSFNTFSKCFFNITIISSYPAEYLKKNYLVQLARISNNMSPQ